MSLLEIAALLGVGLAAGVLGGLLGIGGSIIAIPALTLLFGRSIHLSQAAAMIMNVFVAVPAALRHHRAGAVRWRVLGRTLPFGIVFIIVGVAVGNTFQAGNRVWDPALLEKVFAVFLIYVIANNLHRMWVEHRGANGKNADHPLLCTEERGGWWRTGAVGSIVGFMAGLLGIGGGTLTVPLYQRLCHLPLRQCIATSSALMCLTAVFGAVSKNATLGSHEITPALLPIRGEWIALESLLIAGCLAPTAVLGGLLGAHLTHRLPLRIVRVAFLLLLTVTAIEMLW